jgi:hypothetical protein
MASSEEVRRNGKTPVDGNNKSDENNRGAGEARARNIQNGISKPVSKQLKKLIEENLGDQGCLIINDVAYI